MPSTAIVAPCKGSSRQKRALCLTSQLRTYPASNPSSKEDKLLVSPKIFKNCHYLPTEASAALERMGHKQELKRSFSMVSMLGLAFAILNSWTALAASINLALPSGGPSSVIWGFMVAGICNLALAASLAEFLSAYPTAGGQYHWAAIVSWKRVSRGVSYVTGWISVSGWVALSATGGLLASQFIMDIMFLLHPKYKAEPWHQFLLYTTVTLVALAINTFLTRLLPYLTKAAFFWRLRLDWKGFDATAHMIEEIPEPHVQGPKIMIYCILIGMVTGFIFLSCILFCVTDVERVIVSPRGPLLELFMQATGNAAGSTCLVMFPLICVLFAVTSIMCTSSRMTWAFARDNGLPFSATFAKVHPRLNLPLNALLWTTAWVIMFGFVLLGSSVALSAITAASVVALGITYAIPPTINCLRLRRALPENRAFKLKGATGWVLNMIGIFWTILTTVLFEPLGWLAAQHFGRFRRVGRKDRAMNSHLCWPRWVAPSVSCASSKLMRMNAGI
ncbi:hypothetical protein LMH87_009268 [Akanthomyces muscarius]|uniref:GABA permease n=1 Tax=Akanthomyces muscarius TaxID=2231603 RepID=A0A9W8QBL1_AKAMU|nr:hypothetical protein LMH87_009268 [Akanthomyces muscarius]KAJ4152746.1 hypothetical protein LMH87_009268 [Akanthomyces muscarius]